MKKTSLFHLLAVLTALTLLLAACAAPPAAPAVEEPAGQAGVSTSAPGAPAQALSETQLKNATYTGIYDQAVLLVDGQYNGQPPADGAASAPALTFTGQYAFGDLNDDGAADAVTILAENSGGSGVFVYLAALFNQDGSPSSAGAVLLGDRVQVSSLAIEDGVIKLQMLAGGPQDPACCPTQQVSLSFVLQDGRLVETARQESPAVPPAGAAPTGELIGGVWQWLRFEDTAELNSFDVPDPQNYTLQFLPDGSYALRADCNTGGGSYSLDGASLKLQPGPLTMMACPPGSLDATFLTRLGEVASFVIQDGVLYLNLMMDAGNLVFQPGQ